MHVSVLISHTIAVMISSINVHSEFANVCYSTECPKYENMPINIIKISLRFLCVDGSQYIRLCYILVEIEFSTYKLVCASSEILD